MPSKNVFRVRGLPLTATTSDLKRSLCNEDEGIRIRATIAPSCYDNQRKTALIQFEPNPPPCLNNVSAGTSKFYQMEIGVGDSFFDITIDKDFYGLTQLYPTPENPEITADIVAVTGLAGHAFGSWRGKGSLGRMWLRDFLPIDLPNCRTMTYGYDSKLHSAGIHEILDYNRAFLEELKKARASNEERVRPIIFIGHSFGGIIIAQHINACVHLGPIDDIEGRGANMILKSLVRSKECDENDDPAIHAIYEATYAVIFFGTPHRGLVVDDILGMLDPKVDAERVKLINSINKNSDKLRPELERFVNLAMRLKIVSFYERLQSKRPVMGEDGYSRTGEYVTSVYSDSALLNLGAAVERKIPVDADHTQIVKFDSRDDEAYWSTRCYLQEFEKEAPEYFLRKFSGINRIPSPIPPWGTDFTRPAMTPPHFDTTTAYDAIVRRKLGDLKRLCNANLLNPSNVNLRQAGGTTLLHMAAEAGEESKEMMAMLLGKGADVTAKDHSQRTVLDLAALGGHDDLPYKLARLIMALRRPNKVWLDDLTVNGFAALSLPLATPRKGFHSLFFANLGLLLDRDADITASDEKGWTVLHGTAFKGHTSVVRTLLERGAKISSTTNDGCTVLHVAVDGGHEDTVKLLLSKGADVTAKTSAGATALYMAAVRGRGDIVEALLKRGADVTTKTGAGWTVLHGAANKGHMNVVRVLLENGAEIDEKAEDGSTALYLATLNGHNDVAKLLRGYSPNTVSRDLTVTNDAGKLRQASTHAPTSPGIASVCWGGVCMRIYWQDDLGRVRDTLWNGTWTGGTERNIITMAKESTPLAAVQWNNGTQIRMYYLDNNNIIQEYCWEGSGWSLGSLGQYCIAAAPSSKLAAIVWNGPNIRLYYQCPNDAAIQEYCCGSSGWVKGANLLTDACIGSNLAAVYWNGYLRIYYQNLENCIRELCYDGNWAKSIFSHDALPGSSLAAICWPSELKIRVYWESSSNELTEAVYPGRWEVSKKVTKIYPKSRLSAVCWGVSEVRVFSQGSGVSVNEWIPDNGGGAGGSRIPTG